jgi:DNA-binding transcriptional regulator YhcF (GntR family)
MKLTEKTIKDLIRESLYEMEDNTPEEPMLQQDDPGMEEHQLKRAIENAKNRGKSAGQIMALVVEIYGIDSNA